jgi:hypothetical protein
MDAEARCPACGATWTQGVSCQDHFHQMLAWEWDNPALLEVHHLMVLCYHIQHPSLYSPDGLATATRLLVDFVEQGVTPIEVRRRDRDSLDSGRREHKITGTPASRGAHSHPVQWAITAADVTAGGRHAYGGNARSWARSVLAALRSSSNLPAG